MPKEAVTGARWTKYEGAWCAAVPGRFLRDEIFTAEIVRRDGAKKLERVQAMRIFNPDDDRPPYTICRIVTQKPKWDLWNGQTYCCNRKYVIDQELAARVTGKPYATGRYA